MTTTYDPRDRVHRMALANALLALFERAKFEEVSIPGTKERVFAREVDGTDGKIRVLVYSTIEGSACRSVGKDAIRVCAVYAARDGRERGIASAEKRVNRVGEVAAITDRVIERMRECWKATKTAEKCHCGAPKFKSKARTDKETGEKRGGNLVCADLCWKGENVTTNRYPRRTRSSRGYRGCYRRAAW